jgi:hypothetical protein
MLPVRRSAALALAVLAVVSTTSTSSFAQGRSVSLEDLASASSSVITGRTVAQDAFWDDDGRRILTRVRIAVDDAVVGAASGETEIMVPGGRVGDTVHEVSDMPVFTDGEEVLVFVWTAPDGRNLVTGGLQGKLDIVRDAQGQKVIRGIGHLMRSDPSAGRVAGEPGRDDSRRSRDAVPLESVLERIRSARN